MLFSYIVSDNIQKPTQTFLIVLRSNLCSIHAHTQSVRCVWKVCEAFYHWWRFLFRLVWLLDNMLFPQVYAKLWLTDSNLAAVTSDSSELLWGCYVRNFKRSHDLVINQLHDVSESLLTPWNFPVMLTQPVFWRYKKTKTECHDVEIVWTAFSPFMSFVFTYFFVFKEIEQIRGEAVAHEVEQLSIKRKVGGLSPIQRHWPPCKVCLCCIGKPRQRALLACVCWSQFCFFSFFFNHRLYIKDWHKSFSLRTLSVFFRPYPPRKDCGGWISPQNHYVISISFWAAMSGILARLSKCYI